VFEYYGRVRLSELGKEILRLRAEGQSYDSIARRLGCSKGTISYYVGVGQRDKALKRMRGQKLALRKHTRARKSEKPCMDCQQWYPYFMMDFDHRPDENKSKNVSHINEFSTVAELDEEIAKCDLVCSNCHRLRTWQRIRTDGRDIDWEYLGRFSAILGDTEVPR